jgi:ABC-type lipoprotein release transport system permease subunit
MNGLQHNLKTRSKKWIGYSSYRFNDVEKNRKDFDFLDANLGVKYSLEKNLEGVIDKDGVVVPVSIRSIEITNVNFLKEYSSGASISHDLSLRSGAGMGDKVSLIVPHIVDEFFGDRPRTKTIFITDSFTSFVGEVDRSSLFINFNYLADLTRNKDINILRIYEEHNSSDILELLSSLKINGIIEKTWEEENSSLVHALFLEKTMMIFLFSSLALLISQAITGGFLLVFHRLKFDYAALWLLGVSKSTIFKVNLKLIFFLIFILCLFGVFAGFAFTFVLKYFGQDIMPFVFVERNIPIHVSSSVFLISFCVPLVISSFFSAFALHRTTKRQNHLETVRAIS